MVDTCGRQSFIPAPIYEKGGYTSRYYEGYRIQDVEHEDTLETHTIICQASERRVLDLIGRLWEHLLDYCTLRSGFESCRVTLTKFIGPSSQHQSVRGFQAFDGMEPYVVKGFIAYFKDALWKNPETEISIWISSSKHHFPFRLVFTRDKLLRVGVQDVADLHGILCFLAEFGLKRNSALSLVDVPARIFRASDSTKQLFEEMTQYLKDASRPFGCNDQDFCEGDAGDSGL